MGLSLGLENIEEPIVQVMDEQDVNMYEHFTELLEAEGSLRELEISEAKLLEGCENILTIQKELSENGVSETLKNIVGDELAAIGITLDDADIAVEAMGAKIRAGIQKMVQWIKMIYAKVVDFLKKYLSTQKSMASALTKKAEAINAMSADDWKAVSEQTMSSVFSAADCAGAEGVLDAAKSIVPVAKAAPEGWKAKVAATFSKFQTGYKIVVDNGTIKMALGEDGAAKGKTVKALGWTQANAESTCRKLAAVAKAWANNPVYQEAIKAQDAIVAQISTEANKPEPEQAKLTELRNQFNALRTGQAVAAKVLVTAERSVLAIPTKAGKKKEQKPAEQKPAEPKKGKKAEKAALEAKANEAQEAADAAKAAIETAGTEARTAAEEAANKAQEEATALKAEVESFVVEEDAE